MSVASRSSSTTSKYEDKELFKSIDLKFFEETPEPEGLNATFSKPSGVNRGTADKNLCGSADYEDDFLSDEEDSKISPSFSNSSDDEIEKGRDLKLAITGAGINLDDDARLTDVSPLTSSDETFTEDTWNSNTMNRVPRYGSGQKKQLRGSKTTGIKSATRSTVSTTRLLNPTTNATDVSQILEHVLALSNEDNQSELGNLGSHRRRPLSAKKKGQKNLSVSPFTAREIDRENKRLLSKLRTPHRKPLYPGAQAHPPRKRCTSAGINRTKQCEKIDEENSRILRRLEEVKVSKYLSKDVLENEHKDFVKYALNCSKSKSIAGVTDYHCGSSTSKTGVLDAWEYDPTL